MDKEREKIRKEIFDKPEGKTQGQSNIPNIIEVGPEVNPRLLAMFPPERIRRIMAKEARKYKQALEKKWVNWFSAVSK